MLNIQSTSAFINVSEWEAISPLQRLAALPSLTIAIYGIGGLGVIGLTRQLADLLQLRFARTAATETRGIAQRRAPVKSIVRAGPYIRSANVPDDLTNLVVALEASEALRAVPILAPQSFCLLSDLVIPPSDMQVDQLMTVDDIQQLMISRGVDVIRLSVQQWLVQHKVSDALVSTIALGALVNLLKLPKDLCQKNFFQSMQGKKRLENELAFEWGYEQIAGKQTNNLITSELEATQQTLYMPKESLETSFAQPSLSAIPS